MHKKIIVPLLTIMVTLWSGLTAQIPYYCGFEETVENNSWQFVNGTGVNKWCIGTAAHTSGEMGMYISNDNGEHNYMSSGGYSVWAYRDIYIDSTLNDIILSFDYRNANVSANSAKVFIGQPTIPSGSAAPQSAVQLGGSLSTSVTEWRTVNLLIDSTQRGLLRLYFLFTHSNNSYNSDNRPFAIDNISIVSTHCASPYALKVVSMDSTAALLSWSTPLAGNPGSYTVAYKQEEAQDFTTVLVADTFLLLNGLQYSTPYVWKVLGHCSPSEQSDWSAEKTFISAPFVSDEPFCSDFEDATENAQWRFIDIDSNTRWCIGQATNHGGSSALYVSGDNGATTTSSHPNYYLDYALAYRDIYFPPSSFEYLISMDVKMSDCEYTGLTLWAGEPTTDMSIFTSDGRPVGATSVRYFNNYQTDTLWHHYDLIVDSTYAGMRRLYFQWYEYGPYSCVGTAAVDNFCVTAIPCSRSVALHESIVTDTTAVLNWKISGSDTPESFTLAYRKTSDTMFTEVTVVDTFYVLNGLQTLTGYEWKVRTNCSDSSVSLWSNAKTFTTEQLHVELPYFCDFEDTVENANWVLDYNYGAGENQALIGGAVACGEGHSLYITKDNGVTNSYIARMLVPTASRDIYFTPGYPKYQISFDCKGGGSMQGFLQVLLDGTPISDYLSDADFWTRQSIMLDSSYAGSHQLTLKFDYNTYWNPAGAFDNISIKGVFHETPIGLSTNDITDHTAQLSWTADSSETPLSYRLAWRAKFDTNYTEMLLSASDTTYTLSNLAASSWYAWKVKALYAGNEWSEWSSEKAFQTYTSLPYFCDFEDAAENKNWTIRNGEYYYTTGNSSSYEGAYINRWYIGTSSDIADNQLLFISSDDGVSNSYINYSSAFVWAYRDIYLEPGHPLYQLSLDFRGVGQEGYDFVKLFLDAPAEPSRNPNEPIMLTQIGEPLNLTEQWTHKSFVVDSTHAGAKRLYILWNNNQNTGSNPPAAIDNIAISFDVTICELPEQLTSYPQDTIVTLTWSPGSINNMSSYTIAYKKLSDSVYTELTTQDTSLTIQGLTPVTDYQWKMMTVCDNDTQSIWSPINTFRTLNTLPEFPYLCDFEDVAENNNWQFVGDSYVNHWIVGTDTQQDGTSSLYVSNDSIGHNAYSRYSASSVWAYRDVKLPEGYEHYQISFEFKGKGHENYDYMLFYIGPPVMPQGGNTPAGATQIGGKFVNCDSWSRYCFDIDSSYAGIQRLYLKWTNIKSAGSGSWVYFTQETNPPAAIDNLSIVGSHCSLPQNMTSSVVSGNAQTLSWTGDAPSYIVAYRPQDVQGYQEITVTDTFCTLNTLTPFTKYAWKVRSSCGEDGLSEWTAEQTFETLIQTPYFCDFEDATENAAWVFRTSNTNPAWNWHIVNSIGEEGGHSLSAKIDNSFMSRGYWAYRDIFFDSIYNAYDLTFDYYGMSDAENSNFVRVLVGPPAIPGGSTVSGATELVTLYQDSCFWNTKTVVIDSTHKGLQRLYFQYYDDNYHISYPAYIDNISVVGFYCATTCSNLAALPHDTVAELSWSVSDPNVYAYTIAYKTLTDNSFSEVIVSEPSFNLSNLLPQTTYIWKVKANCTDVDEGHWSEESMFTTTAIILKAPYICDFENDSINSHWILQNGSNVNRWAIDTAANNGGTQALYISNDNGATNAYTLNSTSYSWAYTDIYLDPYYEEYMISFDFKGMGELYYGTVYDYAKVFIGPPLTPSGTGTPAGAHQIGDQLYNISDWTTYSELIQAPQSAYQRIYLLWANDLSSGTNPPAAFDNISIIPMSCGIPHNLTASQVSENDAVLSWTAVYQADSYTVAYRLQSDSTYSYMTVNSNQVTLTNLQPKTSYIAKVRTNCDTSQGVWSDEFQFNTTILPYFCGFEEADENASWVLDEGMNNHKWYIGHAAHCDGDSALYVSNNNGVSNTFSDNVNAQIWAYRDIYFDPQYPEYLMEFDVRSNGYHGAALDYVKVFLGPPATPSGNNIPTNAETIGTFYEITDWRHYRFVINGSHAGMQRLYFLWRQQVAGTNNSLPGAIDNISIVGSPCSIPTELTVSDLADITAVVSWSPGNCGIINDYTVGYRMTNDTLWNEISTTDTFLLLQNLQSSTQYTWRVRKSCVPSYTSPWSDENSFFTEATEAQLPYFCGFEESDENRDWRLLNVGDNRWYIGSAAYQSGNHGLYVSDDNGATNSYDAYGSASNSWAYRDIYFTPGFSEYQIAFDYRGLGQSGNDRTRIFLGPPTLVVANAASSVTIPSQLEELGNGLNADVAWTSHTFTVDSTHAGHQRLYFLWSNDFYEGTNPPGAIDNIMIYGGTCAAPHSLTVTATSTNSISISFTPAHNGDQNWEAVIVEDGQSIDTTQVVSLTSTACTFNNLQNDRRYIIYVRTDCGDGQSAWNSISQMTDCGTIAELPYEEPFDTYGTNGNLDGYSAFPRCWSRLCTSYIIYPEPFIYSIGYYSAPGFLYFQTSNGHEVAITPEFDTSIPLNTLQVSFKFKAISTSDGASLMVGVMTDPSDYATFVPVDTVYPNPYAMNSWVDKVVSLASYAGSGRYIAFAQEHYGSPLATVALDNVVVDYLSACPLPTNVTAEAITHDSVLVDWLPGGSETAWQVVVVPDGTALESGTPVQAGTHPIVIGGLADNTMYNVFVKSDCGSSSSSWCTPAIFMTTCAPVVDLPYTENFDDYPWINTSIVRPDCWIFPVTYADCPRIDWNTYGYYGMESKALLFHSDTSTTATAVTQPFGVDIHSLRAHFKLSADHEYIAGCMEVGVMSDPYDLSTFESVQVFSISQYDTWQDVTVDFRNTAMTGTGKHIAFRQVGCHSPNMAMWVDDIMIYQASDCDAPSALTAYNLTPTSATVAFEPSASASSQWEYVVCNVNASPNFQTPTSVSYTFFDLTNLIPGQSYDVYVRTVCGSNSHSEWSVPLTITTDCGTIDQLPYTEAFDNYGTDNEMAFPDCWRRPMTSASYSYYPIVSSEASSSGIGSLLFFSNSFRDGWAITPAIALDLDSIQLEFKYYQDVNAVPGWDTMLVGVMDSPYDETTFMPVDTITLQTWGVWEPHTVLFDHYPGIGQYVAFRYRCPAYMGKVLIDDVVFSWRSGVGVAEHNLDTYLHIYPNPTTGKCIVHNEQDIIEQLEVYDMYGKRLEQHFIRDYQTIIDLSNRASGIYFVRVTTEQGIIIKRLIKR